MSHRIKMKETNKVMININLKSKLKLMTFLTGLEEHMMMT